MLSLYGVISRPFVLDALRSRSGRGRSKALAEMAALSFQVAGP